MRESQLLAATKDYLNLKHFLWLRNNTGVIRIQGNSGDRYMHTGSKGSPDLLVFKAGKVYGIECKSEKGVMSIAQIEWRNRFEKEGGIYLLVRKLDDIIDIL